MDRSDVGTRLLLRAPDWCAEDNTMSIVGDQTTARDNNNLEYEEFYPAKERDESNAIGQREQPNLVLGRR